MKPDTDKIFPYLKQYVDLVPQDDLIEGLHKTHTASQKILNAVSEERGNFRYAEGKWSVKEIISHLIDTERIFCYRALSIARGEQINLPGYDHNAYTANSLADNRTMKDLIAEFASLRLSTIQLFMSFSDEVLARTGTTNNYEVDVNTLGFMIAGHEIHHIKVLMEKY